MIKKFLYDVGKYPDHHRIVSLLEQTFGPVETVWLGSEAPKEKSVEPFYTEGAWERYVKGVKR